MTGWRRHLNRWTCLALLLGMVWGAIYLTYLAYLRWPVLRQFGDVGVIAGYAINGMLATALYNRLFAKK